MHISKKYIMLACHIHWCIHTYTHTNRQTHTHTQLHDTRLTTNTHENTGVLVRGQHGEKKQFIFFIQSVFGLFMKSFPWRWSPWRHDVTQSSTWVRRAHRSGPADAVLESAAFRWDTCTGRRKGWTLEER